MKKVKYDGSSADAFGVAQYLAKRSAWRYEWGRSEDPFTDFANGWMEACHAIARDIERVSSKYEKKVEDKKTRKNSN